MTCSFRAAVVMVAAFILAGLPALPGQAAESGGMTMMNSVDAALAYNPELKSVQEGREMSVHGVTRARAEYLPKVTAFAGGGVSRRSDSNLRPVDEQDSFRGIADAGIRLTQPLFHGFGIKYAVEGSEARLRASDYRLEDHGVTTVFNAIIAHTDVVRRRALVEHAKKNVDEHAGILRTVQQRFDTGVATTGELNQIRSRHARAKATFLSYESALDAAMANYVRVTGKRPPMLRATPAPKLLFKGLVEVRDRTINNNPLIKGLLADIASYQSEKGQMKSRFYPQFDLAVGPTWSDRDSKASQNTRDFVGEVRVNWEFFSGGADLAGLDMSNAKIRQGRQNLHALMDSLNEDIESTYSRFIKAEGEVREYTAAKKASRAAREDYYRQFLAAQRSLIDVLDAENDFFYAVSQEVLSRTDRVLAAYRLLALAGELLPELHLTPQMLRALGPTTDIRAPQMLHDLNSPLLKNSSNGKARIAK